MSLILPLLYSSCRGLFAFCVDSGKADGISVDPKDPADISSKLKAFRW